LELFQIFLRDFKETPRSRVAKKFVVDDPIIEEDEDQCTVTTMAGFKGGFKSLQFVDKRASVLAYKDQAPIVN
jgi:hypothetical protein